MPSFDDVYGSLNVPDPTYYRPTGVSQQDGGVGRYDQETSGSSDDSGSLSFLDIVDVVNPLHHIPGVSTVYRGLTGDEISPAARVAGSSLYFGPIGFLASTVNAVVETVTGDDVGGHFASLFGEDENEVLAGTENDAFSLSAGADGELSIDEWLQQPPPGSPEAAQLSGFDPVITGTATQTLQQAQQQISQSAARTASSPVPTAEASTALSARPAAPGAVALEALPADILAALMSGDSVRPIEPVMAANGGPAVNPDAGFGSLGVPLPPSVEQDMTPDHLMLQQHDQMPDDPFANLGPIAVQDVTAYSETDTYGQVAADGGWFTLAMTDALAKYDNTASLRQQAQKPFVDVSR